MAQIRNNKQEEERLFDLMERIEASMQMEENNLLLITILINTTEKLEVFQKWIEEHTNGDELTVDEIDIMNEVSMIDLRY